MINSSEEILTKEELSNFLKVTPRTIDNLRKKGLPYFSVGDAVRFDKQKVMDWLDTNKNDQKKTKRYDGHAPGIIRNSLIEAFDDNTKEWWLTFDTPEQAINRLGSLWGCSDIVPKSTREDAVNWLSNNGYTNEEKLSSINHGCSFAQLVRLLKPVLLEVIDESKNNSK